MKKTSASRHHPEEEPLLAQAKSLLRQSGLRARKGLGQHFLVAESVLRLSSAAAELDPGDVVIEVGPGLGVLTRELAGKAGQVFAVELDSKLAALLKQTLAPVGNVTVINDDILSIDPAGLLWGLGEKFPAAGYKVVANLPYYVASAVLRHFLTASLKPQLMVVMVQKEVAQAIVAEPGGMSLLSVSVQFYGEPQVVGYVPASCFYPEPKVDSAVLRIRVPPQPMVAVSNEGSFFALVRAGFSASRKQLANSLAHGLGLSKDEVLPLLEAADILPRRRAETLTINEWERLWQVCTRAGRLAG